MAFVYNNFFTLIRCFIIAVVQIDFSNVDTSLYLTEMEHLASLERLVMHTQLVESCLERLTMVLPIILQQLREDTDGNFEGRLSRVLRQVTKVSFASEFWFRHVFVTKSTLHWPINNFL